jgi:hypothetical protein
MGYACPVCMGPQADPRHLADHLAVTAMVHGDDHEAWLDDHVPDWSEMGPAELGPVVAEHAPETDYPQVFEDTSDHDHGEDLHGLEEEIAGAGRRGPGRGDATAAGREVVAEARELTRQMLDGESGSDRGDDDPGRADAGAPEADDRGDDGATEADDGDADADDQVGAGGSER